MRVHAGGGADGGPAERRLLVAVKLAVAKARYAASVLGAHARAREGRAVGWREGARLRLSGERKLVVLVGVHALATLVTWQHFFLMKFQVQKDKVPDGANMYRWKTLVPPLEFGAMHAILLQMALLPLTMCRHTTALLASVPSVAKLVPFERTLAMHIHVGYVMIAIVALATVLFFVFFGQLCRDQLSGVEPSPKGVHTFCEKMTSEIMCTGYGILAALLVVGTTSYLRHRLPYEVFYVAHHLVFVMFALAIAHTIDDEARAGKERSQTFKWFAGSLALYFADRMFVILGTEACEVAEWKALGDKKQGSRVLILRLRRPAHFAFRSGQYVSLNVPDSKDMQWHPYSIASAPSEPTVDFFIDVVDGGWTDRLWQAARDGPSASDAPTIRMQGPFGSALAGLDEYKHIIAVGSGTGAVPMFSLLKTTYRALLSINPETHYRAVSELDDATRAFAAAISGRRAPLAVLLARLAARAWYMVKGDLKAHAKDVKNRLRTSGRRKSASWRSTSALDRTVDVSARAFASSDYGMAVLQLVQLKFRLSRLEKGGTDSPTFRELERRRRAAEKASSVKVWLLVLPLVEFAAAALGLSWSVLHEQESAAIVTRGMQDVLFGTNMVCLVGAAIWWFAAVSVRTEYWWADLLIGAASVQSSLWWRGSGSWGKMDGVQRLAMVALALYRAGRLWGFASHPTDAFTEAMRANRSLAAALPVDTFKLVFLFRSAAFAEHVWPELDAQWCRLERAWGKYANRASEIAVYVTDRDEAARERLLQMARGTSLYESGALRFGRCAIPGVCNQALLERVLRDKLTGGNIPSSTSTLVTFCGGPQLGGVLHRSAAEARSAVCLIEAESRHTLAFEQENYGGVGGRARAAPSAAHRPEKEAFGMPEEASAQ